MFASYLNLAECSNADTCDGEIQLMSIPDFWHACGDLCVEASPGMTSVPHSVQAASAQPDFASHDESTSPSRTFTASSKQHGCKNMKIKSTGARATQLSGLCVVDKLECLPGLQVGHVVPAM